MPDPIPGSFFTQFSYFKIRSDNEWFNDLPVVSVSAKKSALDLNGSYELVIPNPAGVGLDKFNHFENQELWFAYIPTSTMSRFMAGQVNKINPEKNSTVKIEGRGLQGLFTDEKVNDSWSEKRVDFILCDPTYGAIPTTYGSNITTWNAFTDDFDRFDYWSTARWGAQPSYCEIFDGTLDVKGNAGATRTVVSPDEYNYESMEFRAKVTSGSNTARFGFSNSARTEYVQFELEGAVVNCENDDGTAEQSTATSTSITQDDWNYYRLEWDNGEVRYFVNGLLEVTETSNVPAGNLSPFFEVDTTVQTLMLDYMKVISLTQNLESYLSKQKIFADVVKEMCDIGNSTSSYTYYLDDSRDLHSFVKSEVSSGMSYGYNSSIYSGTYERINSISLNEEAKDLYNYVRVTGGDKLTEVAAPNWTDQYIGDGTVTAFALGYKAKKPLTLLEVNAVAKTEDTDFSVTYGKEHTIIQFVVAPPNGHTVNIRYDYFTPIIATARNQNSIDTYGLTRKYYKNDDTVDSDERASQYAKALLAYFSDPRTVIKVTIPLDPRLEVGQTVNIDAPYRNINDTKYEIIELECVMSVGKWETNMTLVSTDINTEAEIIREILQQLKDLRSRGETTELITDEEILEEEIGCAEDVEGKTRYIADSFVLGHTIDNGKLGIGQIIDDMTDNTNWTPTNLTLSDNTNTDYLWVGGTSVKVDWTNSTEGILDQAIVKDYSAASSGTAGLWLYAVSGADITNVKLRFTDSAAAYSEWNYNEVRGGTIQTLWNYLTFDMDSPDATSGVLDFSDIANIKIYITKADSAGTCYLDYLTISQSTVIGLNGLGYRFCDGTFTSLSTS